jgi:FkbM family methyltransferase
MAGERIGMKALYSFEIHNVVLSVYDGCASQAASRVAEELLNDVYGLETISFQPEDIIIDVGAHVGLVSLYLAKRWPFLRIFAFEPHPFNHANFVENLRLNNVSNVCLFRQAVTADGRAIMLRLVDSNTGGATAVFDMAGAYTVGPVESVTLQDIFARTVAPGQRCRLLKIDCEGMEYEIIPSPVLDRVDYFAAEFHEGVLHGRTEHPCVNRENPRINGESPCVNTEYPCVNTGHARALGELCSGFFPPERMRIVCCSKFD